MERSLSAGTQARLTPVHGFSRGSDRTAPWIRASVQRASRVVDSGCFLRAPEVVVRAARSAASLDRQMAKFCSAATNGARLNSIRMVWLASMPMAALIPPSSPTPAVPGTSESSSGCQTGQFWFPCAAVRGVFPGTLGAQWNNRFQVLAAHSSHQWEGLWFRSPARWPDRALDPSNPYGRQETERDPPLAGRELRLKLSACSHGRGCAGRRKLA